MPNERLIPLRENTDLTTFKVKSDGSEIPGTVEVVSFAVVKEVNRIPTAKITISDGSASSESFDISNQDIFIPGKEIELMAGYHGDEVTIFKGIAVKHSISIRKGKTRLNLECKDAVFLTGMTFKSRVFRESKDSDAIETILGEYSLDNEVEATSADLEQIIQYDATDWGFMINRAEINGMVVLVDDGKFVMKKPTIGNSSLTLQFGATLLEFDGEIDGRNQYPSIKSVTWDKANQEQTETEGADPGLTEAGNLSASQIGSDLNMKPLELFHGGSINQMELQNWADAKLVKSRLSKIRGRALITGFPTIKPGDAVQLSGVGDRFNGVVYVSGVRHNFLKGNWTTDIQIGLDPEWFAKTFEISHSPSSALLPAISGLHIGKVTGLEGDPEGEHRIKVKLPIIGAEAEEIWARISCLDAGDERGTFFRPEIDDEVVLGFLNDDPREPIVLGMLHSSAKPTPEEITDDNHKKGYLSRGKSKLEFDDEKNTVLLTTDAGNQVKLDEDSESILIEDQHGNKIEMSSDGITIESIKDIILKASGDVKTEGMNVETKASLNFKAEGSAGAEVSSSATLTLKGSLVLIN